MNVYRRLISLFYPKFKQQFTHKNKKLSSIIDIDFNRKTANFESYVKFRPQSGKKTINFLLSSDCEVYEVTYLGLPLEFKQKMVRFYNNLQMISFDLPIVPSGRLDLSVTFKYYCTQTSYITFTDNSFMLNNYGDFFPFVLPKRDYPADIHAVIPQNWHLMANTTKIKKSKKHDGQHLSWSTNSQGTSFVASACLKTTDKFYDITVSLLYPRPYLNQARTVMSLSEKILAFFHKEVGSISKKINMAIVEGDFEPYYDGCNIIFSSSMLEYIKVHGKNPKDREKLLFYKLVQLLPNYYLTNCTPTHPDESWIIDGMKEYLGLLAVKDHYGEDHFIKLVETYQDKYLKSRGYGEGLSLSSSAKGLGRNIDLCYPLNVLLFHSLSFLLSGKILELYKDVLKRESISWKFLEQHLSTKYQTDVNWLTSNFIDKHRIANLAIERIDFENLVLKANLIGNGKGWKGPIEIALVGETHSNTVVWDGLSPVKTPGKITKVVLDPNLYIPGNKSPKVYKLGSHSNDEEKVGS